MQVEKNDINALTSCIALLEQYTRPHALSKLITLLSVLFLLYMGVTGVLSLFWLVALAGIIMLGAIEMVYAIRVGFDLALLRKLAGQTDSIDAGLKAIDRALTQLNLLPSDKADRSLDVRLMGCMHLFKIQAVLFFLQLIVVLGVSVFHLLHI